MPWVRLHGVKDYYGMAAHLEEFPEMRCTINLVPSLLLQLQAYSERGASDRYLDMARRPADGLSESDSLFLLDHFFMANTEHMIRPHRRYAELHQKRAAGRNTAKEALRRFHARDLRDLQVWFNLAWIHPLLSERDAELRALRDKGRHFTEDDKNRLLDKHLEILRAIIPLHKKLADSGQIELTTTPYFHPILPLLLDKRLAREAMPEVKLPRHQGGYPEDAAVHVARALEQHREIFGQAPQGMWPAEGSVCQAMLPLLGRHGIRWIATDEEVLGASMQGFVNRDSRGHVLNPDALYRPYKVTEEGHELRIVFRDRALSDMIGFHYQRSDPIAAAEDFIQHLRNIGQAVTSNQALASVILDGENCWEHYPEGGVPFLRALYERCTRSSGIRPVTIGEFLDKHPPRDTLPRLFAGSWIHRNFAIWIGHEEDNAAWDGLHQAREYLRERGKQEPVSAERLRRAWEELYIAEGSDWFWWFGDDHASAQDELFDYLFRKHLQNIYHLLGDAPPADLGKPIKRHVQRALHTMPRAFLDVRIDGRRTFFEWLGAGRYLCHNERGTMAMTTPGAFKEIYFGFNPQALLIRVDFDSRARAALKDFDCLKIGFTAPAGYTVQVTSFAATSPAITLSTQQGKAEAPGSVGTGEAPLEAAIDHIAEVAIPFERLGVKEGEPIQFFVELLQGGQSRDRAPREGTIALTCPPPNFEQIMWDV